MLDPIQLESFLVVTETRNFSEAARRLGLTQSTVSQHVRKLEENAGRRLFVRDTHSVTMTPDGEAMRGFARSILEANARARAYFAGSELRGRIRFGAAEDFVYSGLPDLLRDFMRRHALVDLELTVALSAVLYAQLDAGELDLVLAKRRAGDAHGQLVWRDRLVWAGAPDTQLDLTGRLPLVLYTPPSVTRSLALEAVERDRRDWRITCSSGSLSGLRAAVLAGLGITLHAKGLLPQGLVELPNTGLPVAGDVEFIVQTARHAARGPAAELAQVIRHYGNRLQR
ncbi:MAG TPA: LysR family transcriptional regulator [Stellaceae bacterium]|nr:LysR family transcriptional regulator [Stellaceae bacterium]